MKTVGYVRSLKKDDYYKIQMRKLKAHNVDEIIIEEIHLDYKNSELKKLIEGLNSGDKLVVTEAPVLGQTTLNLLKLLQQLKERGIDIRFIDSKIDTSKAKYQHIFKYAEILNDNDRRMVLERAKVNPGKGISQETKQKIKEMREKNIPYAEISKELNVSYQTISKYANMH